MLYLIGGPAKVGKSKLAERLLNEKQIPYFPTDVFIETLKGNKLGIFGAAKRAEEFAPYFQSMMKILPGYCEDYCVEGNAFMPAQVSELEKNTDIELRACFLGMSKTNLDTILKYAGPQTWLMTNLSEMQRREYPKWLVKNSEEIEQQCKVYGYKYFDLADDYAAKFEQAYKYLSGL